MSLDQKRARIFGVLFLITFVTSIPALLLYEPALRHPVGFIAGSGNVNKLYLGALLELLLIIANIGTAVVIVPIMRRRFEELSIGYVTARLVELFDECFGHGILRQSTRSQPPCAQLTPSSAGECGREHRHPKASETGRASDLTHQRTLSAESAPTRVALRRTESAAAALEVRRGLRRKR